MLCFWNNEILENRQSVFEKIIDFLKNPPPHHAYRQAGKQGGGKELKLKFVILRYSEGSHAYAMRCVHHD